MGQDSGTERISSLVKSLSDPIFGLDSGGRITVWNEAARDLFGYSTPEAVDESITDILDLQDADRQNVNLLLNDSETGSGTESVRITATKANGESIEVELQQIHREPALVLAARINHPIEASTKEDDLIPTEVGKGAATGTSDEIPTGAEALFPSGAGRIDESVYRFAIERSTDLIAAIDQNERLLFANERYRDFHGLGDRLAGTRLTDLFSNEIYTEIKPQLEEALKGQTTSFEMERSGPDGTDHVFDISYFPLETQSGVTRGAVATLREITELKRSAQSLRESWETYLDLFDGIPHPLLLYDLDGEIIEVNEAATHMFGWPENDFLGKNLRELLRSERSERPFRRLERGDSNEEFFETTCRTADGETVPVDIAATRLDYFGTPAILTVARDISEQKAYEWKLERTNASLEEFAAVVSQDLRNPLNVAKGWTEIAREEESLEPLEQVSDSLDRMDQVIDYTLTLSRKGEGLGHPSTFDLGDIVSNSWKAADTGRATLRNEVGLTVRGDRGRVSHLFETLFENCISPDSFDRSIRVGELNTMTGFFVEWEVPNPGQDLVEAESAHIGSETPIDCDLVVVRRIANAHGWRMHVETGESAGIRLRFTGVDVPENS